MTTPSPSPRASTPRPRVRPPLRARVAALVATAGLLGACSHPGTAPAPGVFWTPPHAERAAPQAPPPPQIPPDVIARVHQLTLTDVVDIALRNNTATSAAWAQARSAAAAYGAARGQYYPTVTLDGSVTPLRRAPFGAGAGGTQRSYGPTLSLSWLLLDFGARGGSIGEAREALVAMGVLDEP